MNFWRSLQGTITVELTTPDSSGTITAINSAGIPIYQLELKDSLTIRFVTLRKRYPDLKKLCDKRGETLYISQKQGIYWKIRSLKNRKLFLIGMAVMMLLGMYLPTRIFFVRVEGNHKISATSILEQAGQCGIRFGTSRRKVYHGSSRTFSACIRPWRTAR